MTRKELPELMRPLNEDQLRDIAPSLIAEARGVPRTLIEVLLGANEEGALNAHLLLGDLEELVIVPILEAPTAPSIDDRLWLARSAVNAELALRDKLIAHLDKLLDDKTTIPFVRRGPPVEGEWILRQMRICDDAYLLMRRLRHPELRHLDDEDDPEGHHEDSFRKAADDVKDREIERARKSGDWTRRLTLKESLGDPSPRPLK